MGIESEQLVFDYLSQVGDLAHRTRMPAAERARLVAEVRGDIDRRRAAAGGAQSPAAVRKILGRLGSPEDVVASRAPGVTAPASSDPAGFGGAGGGDPTGHDRAGSGRAGSGQSGTGQSGTGPTSLARNAFRRAVRGEGSGSRWRPGSSSEPAASSGPAAPEVPGPRRPERSPTAAAPPHLAGEDELGPEESDPDWWLTDTGPYGPPRLDGGQQVGGFFGGIEVPEMLPDPPPGAGRERERGVQGAGEATKRTLRKGDPHRVADSPGGHDSAGDPEAGDDPDLDASPPEPGARRPGVVGPVLRTLLGRRKSGKAAKEAKAAGVARTGGLIEWLAALTLVAGAVVGEVVVLGIGWALAYWSPRLGRTEAKAAVMGVPGAVAAVALCWLWGRATERWGEPIPAGGTGEELTAMLPTLLRIAAVASALFLLWRARRPAR